jgi:2-haloacid dehalogenase/putative hydrolase of the HAD superfamily
MQTLTSDIVTFDCYGTLIDWEAGIIAAFQAEAARDGVSLLPDDIISAYMAEEPVVEVESFRLYRDVLGETALRVANRLGWKLARERAGFLAASMREWKPFDDTGPALLRLAKHFSLGILSNVDDDLLAETRKQLSVEFELIVTAERVGSYKPGQAHFREALTRTRGRRLIHAAQSYFHDVIPACELGIPVVWVNRKGERAEGPRPTQEVKDLLELAELLCQQGVGE